jgi:hypothetical protein
MLKGEPRIVLHGGIDATSDAFRNLLASLPLLDFAVDDGSHVAEHQISTALKIRPRLSQGGIYVCEDCLSTDMEHGFKNHFDNVEWYDRRSLGQANDMLVVLRSPKPAKTPFFSIVFPTYNRPKKLRAALKSLTLNAAKPDDIEVFVRVTDTDKATMDELPELQRHFSFTPVIGPRKKGYISLCDYFDEMVKLCRGEWIFQWNDDGQVLTNGANWDSIIRPMCEQNSDCWITAETHRLGTSDYKNDSHMPFHLFERKHWPEITKDNRHLKFGAASDLLIFYFFEGKGWPCKFAKGVTFWHDRDEPEIKRRAETDAKNGQT